MSAAPPPIRPTVVVLAGATGDLARRKLLPGLFRLNHDGHAPPLAVVGMATGDLSDADFIARARDACREFAAEDWTEAGWEAFAANLSYVPATEPAPIARAVRSAAAKLGEPDEVGLLHYLSVPPGAALAVAQTLAEAGLAADSRIVMEKPFGTDLASAVELNRRLHQVFDEDQIFRIDHFLGKEAAQNILAFRFANGLFEPIWNRQFIDHIQIDIPETLDVADRAKFYEATGAYRDMVVTHLFQVLAFVAMEPPTSLAPDPISVEKLKVFRSIRPIRPPDVVRGQYQGYRDLPEVAEDSQVETFAALRVEVDNWRWAGVPFFLRTGKCLAEGRRIISVAFREPPRSMFPEGSGIGSEGPNHLTFDLADDSRMSLSFYGKRPGPGMVLDKISMQYALADTPEQDLVLEAYERLILDAMRGDRTLFTEAAGIEHLWQVSQALLADPPPLQTYPVGSWGPEPMHDLIAPHRWRLPFERAWRE